MFCPECRSELREGFTRCSECDVDLVATLPEEAEIGKDHQAEIYEIVFETSEVDLLPLYKSVLDSAKIPYLTQGEDMANLYPGLGLTLTPQHTAEVLIQVPADRAAEARELLSAVSEVDDAAAEELDEGEP